MIQHIEYFEKEPSVTAGFATIGSTRTEVRSWLAEQGLLIARPEQVHKDRIGVITEEMVRTCGEQGEGELVFPETDAVITSCAEVALTTVHADCLPVWLYDEKSGAMGMAHAGWRGTCAGIAAKMARTMEQELSASVETMVAMIGPGISFCCFEVGPEVYEAFAEKHDFIDEYARKKENGKYNLDLKAINVRLLADLGVKTVEASPLCTACSVAADGSPMFYSYRRENGQNGSMTAWLYRRADKKVQFSE